MTPEEQQDQQQKELDEAARRFEETLGSNKPEE